LSENADIRFTWFVALLFVHSFWDSMVERDEIRAEANISGEKIALCKRLDPDGKLERALSNVPAEI